jgi:hypothetical protein
MVPFERAPTATARARTLVQLPLRDLDAGEYLLNATGDLLRFRHRQAQAQAQGFGAELAAVDPNDLMNLRPPVRFVDENNLYRHLGRK